MIEANGVELCTEPFGDPADPPVLLIMGLGGSMLWWEEGFCRMLADGRRFVLRYDHRDTGRSVTYPPGHPGYSGADLVADAAGVLDAYGIPAAQVVGVSAGGALAGFSEHTLRCSGGTEALGWFPRNPHGKPQQPVGHLFPQSPTGSHHPVA